MIEAFSADGPVCLRGLAITTFEAGRQRFNNVEGRSRQALVER